MAGVSFSVCGTERQCGTGPWCGGMRCTQGCIRGCTRGMYTVFYVSCTAFTAPNGQNRPFTQHRSFTAPCFTPFCTVIYTVLTPLPHRFHCFTFPDTVYRRFRSFTVLPHVSAFTACFRIYLLFMFYVLCFYMRYALSL